ncbi:MAG: putative toxin-antitoxin system toxin component, PIN family [Chitinispirillales bacterium]|jgi:putative PIN family toxin of toxin-antitoxin system|nr:putative toxin-antitoxin system toxin component, PIN family [Chitinispirillales bacterium]
MNVVVDTNVIVSALINANGVPARVLSLVLGGSIRILYDNRIIFEYVEVLSMNKFGFSKNAINSVIVYIKHSGEFINSEPIKRPFSDESDKKFYEVYKSAPAQYLITGNLKHYPQEDAIVSPRDFLRIYES